ncbi:MAG: NADPH:quinone oxidoreductase family protein [Woeseiaceae bacterium]
MKALVCKEYGPPESLVLEEVDDPRPDTGEVVIDIHAAGINFPDILVFAGKYQVKTEPPFIPGYEASGVVSELGEGVRRLAIGDKVIVTPMGGGFGEKMAVSENHAFPLPDGMSFEQGAGFPIVYCTSYHALKDVAKIREGETLLVLGAAGGVGTTAVEIGKAMGARVIAAASTDEKLEFAKSVGADEVINYSDNPLKESIKELTNGKGVDVVYDPVGGELAEQALRGTGWHGRYLVVGFAAGDIPKFPANLALLKEASIKGVFWGQWAALNPELHVQNIREMVGMLAEGKLQSRITATYSLDDYAQAYSDVAGRRIKGKTVFKIR